MINVQFTHGDPSPVATVDFSAFESSGNAYPTCRVLSGSCDHGAAEEWEEPGHIVIAGERRPCRAVYLFDADEIGDDAENYTWDAAHCARVLLSD